LILEQTYDHIILEAHFQRDDIDLGYIVFRRGDRFVEHYFTNRWYNVFEIYDVNDGYHKGWYCNFTRPAELIDGLLSADDLALDLWVYPDGRQLVLDEDEFDILPLSDAERKAVLAALADLQERLPAGNLR
jgi:predicted RNA-binding protein associated with RNAse of E/G family